MFRLWYMPSKRKGIGLAYAESKDGINWTKPMVSKDGKSNIVMEPANGAGLDGATVTIDPSLPYGSSEKYKVAYFPHPGKCQTHLGYSADGINWKHYNNGNPVTGRAADFSNKIPGTRTGKSICCYAVRISELQGELANCVESASWSIQRVTI